MSSAVILKIKPRSVSTLGLIPASREPSSCSSPAELCQGQTLRAGHKTLMIRNLARRCCVTLPSSLPIAQSAPVSMMAEQSMTGAGRIVMEVSSGARWGWICHLIVRGQQRKRPTLDSDWMIKIGRRFILCPYLGPEGEEDGGWFS